MIDRKEVYEEVKYLVKNSWGNLLLGLVIIMILNFGITYILDIVFPTRALNPETINTIQRNDIFTGPLVTGYEEPLIYSSIKVFITSFVSFIFSGAYSISILEFIREKNQYPNRRFSVDKFFKNLQKYASKLLIAALIITLINTILNLIPIIGTIITLILTVLFAFVVFIIPDYPEASGIDYFKLSIDETKGIRKDLILLTLKYLAIPFGIFFIGVILSVLLLWSDSITGLGVMLLIIPLFLILLIRSLILQNIGLAVLYDINYSNFESESYKEQQTDYDRTNYNEPYLDEKEKDILYKKDEKEN